MKSKMPEGTRGRSISHLSPRGAEVLTHILNSVAFESYGDCCSIDDMAARFKTTATRLRRSLQSVLDDGLITIEGETFPVVYPTVRLLRRQDRDLTESEAAKIVSRIKRA